MSATTPLMPKATAVWLVDNTSLTFEQIAEFCGMHLLEVKGIADGDVGQGIRGKNPVTAGELTREDISDAEADPDKRLKLVTSKVKLPDIKTKKRPRYTPVSRRQDRPNAVVWLLRHHPELKDSQIIRLVGTTKPTIQQIRERTHWNSSNLVPQDPVTLGLCKQMDLDSEVEKAVKQREKEQRASGLIPAQAPAGTLLPTTETTDYNPLSAPGAEQPDIGDAAAFSAETVFGASERVEPDREEARNLDEAARVFARLQEMSEQPKGGADGEAGESAASADASSDSEQQADDGDPPKD